MFLASNRLPLYIIYQQAYLFVFSSAGSISSAYGFLPVFYRYVVEFEEKEENKITVYRA